LSNQVIEGQGRDAQLSEQLDHYRATINQAALDLEAIRSSARWKTGHRLIRILEILLLRGDPRLVMDEMANRLKHAQIGCETLNTAAQPGASANNSDIALLREWMGLLDADFRDFLNSMRWRVGNTLVRTIEIGIGRGKPPLATDHLREVLRQATDWAPSGDEDQDIRQFEIWFTQIDRALQDLLASKRWLVGNSLLGAIDRILWRGHRRLVVDHMREVLDYYEAWRGHRHLSADDEDALARFDALAFAPEPGPPCHPRVDVIVPVFNALEDVKRCLASILAHDDGSLTRLIVINDGSDQDTHAWLNQFSQTHEKAHLIEHPVNKGYTQAVNTGLGVSTAPIILILNSDTIVTRGWLVGLLRCLDSDPGIGIVGPLSNAATWQNVPDLYDADHQFANNLLPAGMSPNDMALVVAHASARAYPATPFVNGFCFMFKREVMDAIGVMDQEHFPIGYGEENDYCLRAVKAGYQLRIADDVYVFHAQSKSFGHERRQALSTDGFQALERKHGILFFHAQVSRVKDTRAMDLVRGRIHHSLAIYHQWVDQRPKIPQGIDSKLYLPRHHPLPPVPSEDITVHIIVYSDHPGPELRLTLDALSPSTLAQTRFLHLAADWPPVEQRFQHQALFAGQVHHFSDERGFYAAVKTVMDDIGSAYFCVIRQGVILLPSVVNALLDACASPSGYAAASPVTNRLTGLAIPLSPGGTPLSTNAKLALTHGDCLGVVTPMLDLEVFMLSKQALETVPFPSFANDKTDQSLVRFFVALTKGGFSLGILLSRYAFKVSNGPFAPPRAIEAIASLAQPEDGDNLAHRMTIFKQLMSPWKKALQHSQPRLTTGETVCVLMSTLHLFGGVIVLVNLINQLILTGVDVRVYVLHYDGTPAPGLRLLFDPKPLTDPATLAAELPRAVRILATLWSTVAIAEELVSLIPAARGYYFIQDYETLFYRNNPAEHSLRRAADATYWTPLRKVVTSRWIADQLPAAAKVGPDSIERIPVGIDHSIFPPTERNAIPTDSPPVILAMARPETPRRGFTLLIAALTRVKARHPRVQVHLFGTTSLSQHPIPFTYVDFGIVHSSQLRQVYADANIFVDSSDFQGFGLCPLEAMALGCSCVLTDSGGILEYATHEVNALIVPHQSEALAEAIAVLIEDPALRHRLGAAGVETARAFDCSRTTRDWLQLFARERVH
jgi:GT2 family glycosyltransferase/glycosyltransferase involved in cell wall biosynthesis